MFELGDNILTKRQIFYDRIRHKTVLSGQSKENYGRKYNI